MKKRAILFVPCLGLALVLAAGAAGDRAGLAGGPGGDELGQIEKSIRACIGWAKTKDFPLLYSVIANDADFLEVHPDGAVVKGFEQFKKAEKIWASPDFKAVRYEIRDLRIKLSKSGDVAWFFCLLDDINEWKGQLANWENTRWAGVLVSSGDTKVLIDALFDKPKPEYRAPAPEVLDKIMKGEAPFDGVDVALVTHNHPDHFDASVAVRFLEALPGPVLLAPSDAVAEMRKVAADWSKIETGVISLDLKVGEKEEKDLNRIPVTAFRTLHSGDRESPKNLMYLFELHGRRVFHEGDSTGKPEVYQGFGLGGTPVDLALVHYWFPLEPNCARFLQEVLKPDHVALTHLPIRLEGDAPGKIDQVRQYYKDIFLLLPGIPTRIIKR